MGRPPLRLGRPKGRPQAPFQPSHENRYPFTNWSTFAPPKWSKFTPPLTLQQFFDYFASTYQAELRKPDASLPEIRGYFEILLKLGEGVVAGRGCLLCNSAIEVAPHDKQIAADIRRFFDNITGVFRNALHNAKTKGEIHPDTQIDDWAVSLTGLIQSSALMVRVGYPVATIQQNVEAALAGLENR